ncbi:MAG: hypothetical protein RIS64_1531 [Bacteroidota bacterium]|jgi:hypothetical protein
MPQTTSLLLQARFMGKLAPQEEQRAVKVSFLTNIFS